MALTPGSRLGAYEVLALLGSGGMGEVYRARDTRLDRLVAIKVLAATVADDPDRRQRLDREARAISSLNHPHICTLYDVGRHDGIDYLVMELLEGQTLAERLTRGALPLDEAVRYAIELADALDVAHRHGIVHRDLKPANVFLARSGSSGATVTKLLDFGIAKAAALAPAAPAATLTHAGTLLGTVQYLAPEQLEGRDADARSDLFAFGAVLYEMLTGRRAFNGESQASVIAAVLDSEPPLLSTNQSLTPPALEHLVTTCLAKNPDERWQAAGDVKCQLEWIAASGRSTVPAGMGGQGSGRGVRVSLTGAVTAALMALIAGGALTWYVRTGPQEQTAPPKVTRTTIMTSGTAALAIRPGRSLAITPDGTRVVYIGNNGKQLFVRPTDRFDSREIFTAAGPLNDVFISPNGKSAGFIEGGILNTIGLDGGPAQRVTGSAGYGATWESDDTIIFPTNNPAGGLQRVSVTGGDVTMLTRPVAARGEAAHVYPAMLPGARAVLFTITATTGGLDAAQVAVLDLVTRSYKVLVGGSDPRYVPGEPSSTTSAGHEIGHLVYVKGAALMAIRFDPARMEIHGTPVMVLPRLTTHPSGIGAFDVAGDGTIVYADAPSSDLTAGTLVLVDRQRRETPLLASLPPRPYRQPRLSPDEMQVAMAIADQEKDIWVFDLARPLLRQLTSGPLEDFFPVWTPDSRRLIFNRLGGGLFRQLADGTGTAEVLQTESGPPMLPSGMTPDGRVLFSRGRFGVMAMTLDGRRVEPLVQALDGFNVRNGVISPDGRWLAYESDHRQQRFEIYVTPYPNVKGDPRQVSMAGGTRPLWSKNSHELFFEAPDGAIMAARFDPSGGVWRSDEPMKVIDGPYATGGTGSIRNWDVAKDGRFLMVKAPRGDHSASQIQFVQHWADELQRLVPATR